jgi:hypothetical protein
MALHPISSYDRLTGITIATTVTICGTIQGDWFVADRITQAKSREALPSDAIRLRVDRSETILGSNNH